MDHAVVQAFEDRGEIGGDERRLRAGVVQHEGVVVAGEPRVDRHRHDARLDGAEEAGVEIRRVVEAEQDALLAPHPQRAERMREPARRRVDVGIAVRAPRLSITAVFAPRPAARLRPIRSAAAL